MVMEMMMRGKSIGTLAEFNQNFSIDELLYGYYSGELEIFLIRTGEREMAEKVHRIEKNNAYLLLKLYEIFGFDFKLSDEEIRLLNSFNEASDNCDK